MPLVRRSRSKPYHNDAEGGDDSGPFSRGMRIECGLLATCSQAQKARTGVKTFLIPTCSD